MQIKKEDIATGCCITLTGRLDAMSAPRFEEYVKEMGSGGVKNVLLDISALDYISSAGLRTLLKLAKVLKDHGKTLALCGAQAMVRDVMIMSGFDRILPLFPDRTAAGEALGA